jgi:hypothetical protein
MYLVLIAWLYVALMMAIAEAVSPVGSVLGAIVTFVLYGLLPMGIVGYILNSPARRRASAKAGAPDADGEASRAPVTPVGKEPL